MQIRPLTEADRKDYLSMARDFYHSPAVDHCIPDEFLLRTFDALMTGTPFADGYLFETEEGQAAGYALTANTWSQEAGGLTVWIEELYLKEALRGQGAGGAFFDFLKREKPAARYRLETEPDNDGAKRLYARQGFRFLNYESYILGD